MTAFRSTLLSAVALSLLLSSSSSAQVWAQGRLRIASPTPGVGSFGAAVAVLDFDGDGDFEIAVGDPGAEDENGYHPLVRILAWSGTAWVEQFSYGPAGKNGFGSRLAVGDFDEDDRDDLLVGAPGWDSGAGAVYLFHHEGAGSIQIPKILDGSSFGGGGCGSSLAVGDFDDDNDLDFAAGCPYASFDAFVGAGRIILAEGFGSGNFGTGTLSQASAGVDGGPETGDEFGAALAAGDFDGDGAGDVAVGVPGEDTDGATDTGAVHVLFGAASGLSGDGSQIWHQGSTGIPGISEDGDRFGEALGAGDFDSQLNPPECNCDELVIGIPDNVESTHGSALVLPGSLTGPTATGVIQLILAGGSDGVRFGAAFATGRLDPGFTDDLVIGVEGKDDPFNDVAGSACTLFGSSSGLASAKTCFDGGTGEFQAAGGGVSFGTALAIGSLDDVTGRELVIGNGDGREVFVLRSTLFSDGFELGFTDRWSFASDD